MFLVTAEIVTYIEIFYTNLKPISSSAMLDVAHLFNKLYLYIFILTMYENHVELFSLFPKMASNS